MAYREELDAARARIEALEEDLARAKAEQAPSMTTSDELDAARVRIEALEEELIRAKAEQAPVAAASVSTSPATRRLVDALRAERRAQLDEIDRRSRLAKRMAPLWVAASFIPFGVLMLTKWDTGASPIALVMGIGCIAGALLGASAPSRNEVARDEVQRDFSLRIAEAEARGEVRGRAEIEPPRGRIAVSRSDAGELETLSDLEDELSASTPDAHVRRRRGP